MIWQIIAISELEHVQQCECSASPDNTLNTALSSRFTTGPNSTFWYIMFNCVLRSIQSYTNINIGGCSYSDRFLVCFPLYRPDYFG